MRKKIIGIFCIVFCLICISGCGKRPEDAEKSAISEKTETSGGDIMDKREEKKKEKQQKEEPKEKEGEEDPLPDASAAAEVQKTEEPAEIEKQDEPAKKGILVALDPGHQAWEVDMSSQEPNAPGSDVMKARATSGTSGQYSGIAEFELNLTIALKVKEKLIQQGYDVLMTREDNQTAISNAERATLANQSGADISVRIHANGSENPGASGALVLIGSAGNPYVGSLYDQSYRLGSQILEAYCGATGMTNLGIQENDTMTGINWSTIPVIILEMGFMTNMQDDLNMADGAYQERMAEGIVNGINAYYGF